MDKEADRERNQWVDGSAAVGAAVGAIVGSAIVEVSIHPSAGESPKYDGGEQAWAGLGFFGGAF